LGEQAQEKIQPDSTKSTTQQASENVTGLGDKVLGSIQPQGDKSATQKLGDTTRSGADEGQNQGAGLLGGVTDTVSGVAQTGVDTVKGLSK
jgi:hypothetical protein